MQWSAAMISPAREMSQAPLLRGEVVLDHGHGAVISAFLHVSSLGIFDVTIDGRPVDDDVLSPGWTSYEWRLRYRTYNVTSLVRERSVIGILLGNGWFRGRLGWTGARAIYGDRLGAIAQLEVRFADGHRQVVGSNETWRAGNSDVVANDLYDGQRVDARVRDDRWERVGADLAGWAPVAVIPFDTAVLVPYVGPVVRRQEVLAPASVWTSPLGRTLVDFGQNLVGWVRLRVTGPVGSEVVVRHAEVLDDGELGVRPLRSALARDTYVLSGGEDRFEPTMTFHGFRYIEITGWPGTVDREALEAVVVHSDLQRIGRFVCSDPSLNQLHSNVVWGMKGNFLDVPTDCPQRDERLGWTGDIAVFAPSAAFLFDVGDFLADWLLDLGREQEAAGGIVPFVVPDALKYLPGSNPGMEPESTAIWGDAAVWVPWALWQAYGELRILHDQYSSMASHARRVEELLSPSGLWDQGFQFGDWLDPLAPPEDPFSARANSGVVATACAHRTASILAQSAHLTGHHEDALHFTDLADRLREAFATHYLLSDGRIVSDAPTVYALAIVFGLLEGRWAQFAGERLAQLAEANGFRIGTGFAGTAYIADALTMTGHLDHAYRLLMEDECPSWLYPVKMGATTIWERWDSMMPDGSINPGDMTSFNHYALGSVVDWMHRTIGGISPLEPGYSRIRFAPRPGGGLTWARTSLDTPHGTVELRWDLDGAALDVQVTVPDGVSAEVDLPGMATKEIASGTHCWRVDQHHKEQAEQQ